MNKAGGLWGKGLILDVCSQPWGHQDSVQEPWRGRGWGLGWSGGGELWIGWFASERCAQNRVLTLLSNELTLEG